MANSRHVRPHTRTRVQFLSSYTPVATPIQLKQPNELILSYVTSLHVQFNHDFINLQ